ISARSVSSGTLTGSIAGKAASAGLLPLASGIMTASCDCKLDGTFGAVTGTYDAGWRLGGGGVDEAGVVGIGVVVITAGASTCAGAFVTGRMAVPVDAGADTTDAGVFAEVLGGAG